MLRDALDAFVRRDVAMAEAVIAEDVIFMVSARDVRHHVADQT
jgi:ketosteroid isomerase-like protein